MASSGSSNKITSQLILWASLDMNKLTFDTKCVVSNIVLSSTWSIKLFCILCSKSNHILDLKMSTSTSIVFVTNHLKIIIITSSLQRPNSTQKYLNNHTCYDKIVCTILFSSRWRVYWYELFSILSTLWKWQNFDETPSL